MTTAIRILIVDLDPETLKACEEVLSSRKATTVTTSDSRTAMREFCALKPDIVLTELVMPGKDGIELLLEIKRTAPQTKVIAMSAGGGVLPTEFVFNLARKLGADGVISKPVDGRQLLETIETALSPQADE